MVKKKKEKKVVKKLLQYGFTCVTESDGTQRPQCMLCNNKLNNSSLAPAKVREHFAKVHGTRKYAGTTHDQFKQKRARFGKRRNAMLNCILIQSYVKVNGYKFSKKLGTLSIKFDVKTIR